MRKYQGENAIVVSGNYAQAVVYTRQVEESALQQIQLLCDQPSASGSCIRIMPDVHAGAGCTIGTTMTIGDKIIPNLVGVDIGCGMETVRLSQRKIELHRLDKLIYSKVPSGFAIRETPHIYAQQVDLSRLRCARQVDLDRGYRSIGTLGGGNHFIELDRDEEDRLYLVVHSGSRHLGLEVAQYYQQLGYGQLCQQAWGEQESLLEQQLEQASDDGKKAEIVKSIRQLRKRVKPDIPQPLAYLTGTLMEDYLHDMKIVQQFALWNRQAIVREIVRGMKWEAEDQFSTIHNYVDVDSRILRKGAVSAQKGERLLIPINMRDGSLICVGKGNKEWNCSAPHGAGRLMSRKEAKSSFTVSSFKREMEGIYTTSVRAETLDECPMAYKSMEDILKNIGPTAEVVQVIRPVYNFKAGAEE